MNKANELKYIRIEATDAGKTVRHNLIPTTANVANFFVQNAPQRSMVMIDDPLLPQVIYHMGGATVLISSNGSELLPDLQEEIDRLRDMDPAELPEVEYWTEAA